VSQELLRLPYSVLNLSNTNAIAFMLLLHSKPKGASIRGQEVMDQFKIGKSVFYRARKILLESDLITEEKKYSRKGHFDGVYYRLVPCETAVEKLEHGDQPHAENQNAVDLARSVQKNNSSLKNNASLENNARSKSNASKNNSCFLNDSNNNVVEEGFKTTKYSESFEKIWKAFPNELMPSNSKGDKYPAYNQFKKLKMSDADVDWLIGKIKAEVSRKKYNRDKGEFDAPFKQVVRIFKYRAWESWPDSATSLMDGFEETML